MPRSSVELKGAEVNSSKRATNRLSSFESRVRLENWCFFNLILRLTLALHFKDTQCGFKAFKQTAVQAIFPLQKIERWGFDPEILFLARKLKFKVQEVPVAWGHRGGTSINPLADGARMIMEMLRIRWYDLTGKYAPESAPSTHPAKPLPDHRGPQS